MAQRIAGTAWYKVNGAIYPLRGNFTVSPSAVAREGLAGQDYVHGYSELPRVPSISGDVSLDPALSMDDVEAAIDVTVTAELANGKVLRPPRSMVQIGARAEHPRGHDAHRL